MKKKVAIIGGTGSIGKSTFEVIRQHSDKFDVVLASAHTRYKQLFEFGEEFAINHLAITKNSLKHEINAPENVIFGNNDLLKLMSELDYDILLNAVVGSAGLKYTLNGIKNRTTVALANKESMVMCGDIVNELAEEHETDIIPVDSEHSAIMQCLMSGSKDEINRIILTASGGPFLRRDLEKFDSITLSDTLKHPTWDMGNKITVDSATMANKGLEVIEAHHLFHTPYEKIDIVIHPQSIIHSFVEFIDGSIISQLSFPDMKIPIQLALSYPKRIQASANFSDICKIPQMSFLEMDHEKFPILKLAYQVGKAGGIMPTIFNAANEAAVNLFLKKKIHFTDIHKIISKVIQKSANIIHPDYETIIEKDKEIKNDLYQEY